MSNYAPESTGTASAAKEAAGDTAGVAAEQGRNVASTISDQAKTVADEARSQVSSVAGEARQQAARVVDDASTEFRQQLEQRLSQLVHSTRGTSEELRALSDGRTDEAGRSGELVRQASDRLADLADRADELGLKGLTDEAAQFARRRPLMFLAGAAAAGLLAGRALRSVRAAGENGSSAQTPAPAALPSAAAELGALGGPTGAVTPTETGQALTGTTVPASTPATTSVSQEII